MSEYEGTPSDWDWSPSITEAELRARLAASNSRLISVHRPDPGQDAFAAVWVANDEGIGWDWSPGIWARDLRGFLDGQPLRLIHVDTISTSDVDVFLAAVWIDNTGAHQREWDWDPALSEVALSRRLGKKNRLVSLSVFTLPGLRGYSAVWILDPVTTWGWLPSASIRELSQALEDARGRLITVDSFVDDGGAMRYAAAWVENPSGLPWWWGSGQNGDTIRKDIPLFCSFMVEARTLPGHVDSFVHVRHGFPQDAYAESDRLVELRGTAKVVDVTINADGYFDQESTLDLTLENVAGEAVEIEEADVIRTFAGWFWPDVPHYLQHAFDPGGMFSADARAMPAGAAYSRSLTDHEWGLTQYVARVRARTASGRRQRAVITVPIDRPGFASLPTLPADVPVSLGLWSDPVDLVPLVLPDAQIHWYVVLGGSIVNWSGEKVLVAGLHALVKNRRGRILADRELTHDFRVLHYPDWPTLPPSTRNAYADLTEPFTVFIDNLDNRLLDGIDPADGLDVRLTFNYKLASGWCGAVTREVRAETVTAPVLRTPVEGRWNFGNGFLHTGFDPHAHYHERYSYDLGIFVDGSDHAGPADQAASFHAYGKEVHACLGGEIMRALFTHPEHDPGAATTGGNEVIVKHDDDTMMRYGHLQAWTPEIGGRPMQVGDRVDQGQVVGRVGNSGTSVPHLHFDLWGIGRTGHPRPLPMRFENLHLDADGYTTPATGEFDID